MSGAAMNGNKEKSRNYQKGDENPFNELKTSSDKYFAYELC